MEQCIDLDQRALELVCLTLNADGVHFILFALPKFQSKELFIIVFITMTLCNTLLSLSPKRI